MTTADVLEPPTLTRRGTVLVVDDEEGVRASIRAILDGTCEVLEAETGAVALELLKTREVDLVMLDQRMPGEPGIDVLPKVKAADPSTIVVLATAVHDLRTAVEALKRGAYDYITKPFDVDDILMLVERALEKRALEREVLAPALGAEPDRRDGARRLRGADRSPSRDGEDLPAHHPDRDHAGDGADHRRERHRQGAGGPRHPPAQRSQRAAVRGGQRGGDPRHAGGVRAVRSREGRVHQRPRAPPGQVRAGPRRHALPGRDRLAPPRPAGQAAARAAGARDRAARRHPADRGGRAGAGGHQRGSPPGGPGPRVPRRPLLSAQRGAAPPAAAARAARGHPAPGRALHPHASPASVVAMCAGCRWARSTP